MSATAAGCTSATAICSRPSIPPTDSRTRKPDLNGADPPRLEMCAGTLFMIKFVNLMEGEVSLCRQSHPGDGLDGHSGARRPLGADRPRLDVRPSFSVLNRAAFLSAESNEIPVGAQLLNADPRGQILAPGHRGALRRIARQGGHDRGRRQEDIDYRRRRRKLIEQFFRANPSLGKWI